MAKHSRVDEIIKRINSEEGVPRRDTTTNGLIAVNDSNAHPRVDKILNGLGVETKSYIPTSEYKGILPEPEPIKHKGGHDIVNDIKNETYERNARANAESRLKRDASFGGLVKDLLFNSSGVSGDIWNGWKNQWEYSTDRIRRFSDARGKLKSGNITPTDADYSLHPVMDAYVKQNEERLKKQREDIITQLKVTDKKIDAQRREAYNPVNVAGYHLANEANDEQTRKEARDMIGNVYEKYEELQQQRLDLLDQLHAIGGKYGILDLVGDIESMVFSNAGLSDIDILGYQIGQKLGITDPNDKQAYDQAHALQQERAQQIEAAKSGRGWFGQHVMQGLGAAGDMFSRNAIYQASGIPAALETAAGPMAEALANYAPDTLTPTLGQNAVTSAARLAGNTIGDIVANPTNVAISFSSGLNKYDEAKTKGATDQQAFAAAIGSAALEYFSNKLFSGTPLEDNPAEQGYVVEDITEFTRWLAKKTGSNIDGVAQKFFNNSLMSYVFDKSGEGMEEVISGVFEPWIDRLTFDPDADLATLEGLWEEFLGGVFMSVVSGVAEPVTNFQAKKAAERAEAALQYAFDAGTRGLDVEKVVADMQKGRAEVDAEDLRKAYQAGASRLQQYAKIYGVDTEGKSAKEVRAEVEYRDKTVQDMSDEDLRSMEGRAKDFRTAARFTMGPNGYNLADSYTNWTAKDTDYADYFNEAYDAYEMGREGAENTFQGKLLDQEEAEKWYRAGQADARLEENNGQRYQQGQSGNAGEGRVNGVDSAQQRGGVAEGAEYAGQPGVAEGDDGVGRAAQEAAADANQVSRQQVVKKIAAGLKRISPVDAGLTNGTRAKTMKMLGEDTRSQWHQDMIDAEQEAAKEGVKVKFYYGYMGLDDGKGAFFARGLNEGDGSTIWIRADSEEDLVSLVQHELYHTEEKRNPELDEQVRQAIVAQAEGQERLNALVQKYAENYKDSGMTDEQILREIFADANGKIDIFKRHSIPKDASVKESARATDFTETVRRVVAENKNAPRPGQTEGAVNMASREQSGYEVIPDTVEQTLEKNGATVRDTYVVADSVARIMDSPEYHQPVSVSDLADMASHDTLPDWAKKYINGGGSQEALESIQRFDDMIWKSITGDFTDAQKMMQALVPSGKVQTDKYGPLRTNVEYRRSFDMDTSCPRTFQFVAYRNAIMKRLNRALTFDESINLLNLMSAYHQMIPCTYCYVENKRILKAGYYNNFYKFHNAVLNGIKDGLAVEDLRPLMYGWDAEHGKLTSAAEKTLTEVWMKDKSGYNPTIAENYHTVNLIRNAAMHLLDGMKAEGKIKAETSVNSLTNIIANEYGIKSKGALAEVKKMAADWRYDAGRNAEHVYLVEDIGEEFDKSIADRALELDNEAIRYANSASSAKTVDNYAPYGGELENISEEDRKYILGMGGIRKHSSNDFRIDYVLDYFQFFADLAKGKWTGHTYTKNGDYVRIFGLTGDMINMSIAFNDTEDGVTENVSEGMEHKLAKELRKAYRNAGVMAMVTSDKQLSYALNADWVDMIIPFHNSGLPKEIWYNMKAWADYTSVQSESLYNGDEMKEALKSRGVDTKGMSAEQVQSAFYETFGLTKAIDTETGKIFAPHFYPYETVQHGVTIPGHGNSKSTYMDLCRQYGVHPRFDGVMVQDADGNTINVVDHENYMKLVKETAAADENFTQPTIEFSFNKADPYLTEKYGKQLGKKSVTPMDYAMDRLMQEAKNGGYQNAADDQFGIVDEFIKEYAGKGRPLGWLSDRAEMTKNALDTAQDKLVDANRKAMQEEFKATEGKKEKPKERSNFYTNMANAGTQKSSVITNMASREVENLPEGTTPATRSESLAMDATDDRNVLRYRNEISAVLDGTMPSNQIVLIGRPSAILAKYLKSDNPLYISQNSVKHIALPKTEKGGKHGFGRAVLDQIVYQFEDPMAITGNTSKHVESGDNSIVVWTDWKNDAGDSIIVPIRIDVDGSIGIYNNVNTAFNAWDESYVEDILRDGNVFYTRDGKSIADLLAQRRDMPKWKTEDALSENDDTTSSENVNTDMASRDVTNEAPDKNYNRNATSLYSLEDVPPVQSSGGWERGATFDEVKAAHPTLFELAADEAEVRNPTQITGTVKTYRKIYDILKAEGFKGKILDASSGLGVGTEAGRSEYGFNVDDIEPFPDAKYKPKYTDYSKLNKQYDAIISNAVLNVIPQDLRDAMVVKIGQLLAPGGKAFINVRGTDVKNASSKVAINEDGMEYFISDSGSYQKGFRKNELISYLKDALGDGYTVEPTNQFGGVAAIVTKNGGENVASREIDVGDAKVYNSTVVLKEDTVDKYLKDYASKGTPNYAQAYITYMSPKQFLDLTTSTIGRITVSQETGPLDLEKLKSATVDQPIQLNISGEEVTGHEGRHRALALERAGIRKIPVLLFDTSNKYSKTAMDSMKLTGQDFGRSRSYATVTVEDVQPLSYGNRDVVIEKFATQPANERLMEKYNGRETVMYSRETDTRLQQKNIELQQRLDAALADTKLTNGWRAAAKDVQRVAADIIDATSSKESSAIVEQKIRSLVEAASNGGIDSTEMKDLALDIARGLLKRSSVLTTPDSTSYDAMRKYLKSIYINVPTELRKEFTDWKAFAAAHKAMRMKTDGVGIGTVYSELQKKMGEDYFPKLSTDMEKLQQIAEILDNLTPIYDNPYSVNMADATEETANDILDAILDIGQAEPTYADKAKAREGEVRSLYQQKLAEQKEYLQQRIQEEADKRREQVEALRQHYAEMRETQRTRKQESADRQKLLRVAKRLQNRKLTAVNRAIVDQLVGDLDTVSVNLTNKSLTNLRELADWYESYKDDPNFLSVPQVEEKLKRLEKRHIGDMTIDEVRDLTDVLRSIENSLAQYGKMIRTEDRRLVSEMSKQSQENIRNTKGSKKNIADWLVTNTLAPERLIRRLTGYNDSDPLYQRVKELSDGQRKMFDYQMRAEALFSKWTNDKKLIDRLRNKETVKIRGFVDGKETTVEITPDMRMALYLHSLNDQNLKHIMNGGVTIPDIELYRKGDIKEAYSRGKTVKMSPDMVRGVANGMSAEERAFANAAHRYFNGMSRDEINAVSEALLGYSLAQVENYFPIQTDDAFTQKEIDAIQRDGSIQGMGFAQERVNASNAIFLVPMTDVLNRSIQNHAKYVGMAIPVANVNKLWKANTVDGETDATSGLKDTMRSKWGNRANEAVESIIADVQNPSRKSDDASKALAKIRSNYAGAVLTLNASVALKQAASYPTAAAVLGWEPLIKAMGNVSKVNTDLIAKYTPLYWYRSKGYSTQELGDIRNRGGLMDKVLSAHITTKDGKEIPLLNWIQGVDLLTTRTLWKASEYYVQQNQKNLRVGTDDYYKAVADAYNKVIEQTQPNYTTMQRPQLLRTDNQLLQSLVMFKTQPFQNFGILYDAIGELRAAERMAKNGDSSKLTQAKKNAVNAITSNLVSAAVFAAMTMAWALARRKREKYEDDEGNFSPWKQLGKDILSSEFGMIPFGSDAYNLIASGIFGDKYYGLSNITSDSLSGALESTVNLYKTLKDTVTTLLDGDDKTTPDPEKLARNLFSAAQDASKLLGIPLDNVVNLMTAVYSNVASGINGEYVTSYEMLRLTKGFASSTNKSAAYDILYKASQSSDKTQYNEIRSMMIEDGFKESNIDAAMKKRSSK